jgi:DNA repair exonuclease SbcCD ATPase subunit
MQQILKRLELIKTSITIEDEDIIDIQIKKLKSLKADNNLKNILLLLEKSDYSNALLKIEKYISKFSGLVVYEDKELNSLRLELKVLEKKLTELNEEKNELSNQINDFNTKYNLVLGELIKDILQLRKDILYKKTIKSSEALKNKKTQLSNCREKLDELAEKLKEYDPFDEDYDKLYQEFKEAKNEYDKLNQDVDQEEEELENDENFKEYRAAEEEFEKFYSEYETIIDKNINELSEQELIELKKIYKKAAKLCHPDIVADELKEQALKIIQELNAAYEEKDLQKIKEIFVSLESGNSFETASDSINDKEKLKEKIAQARAKTEEILSEIDDIKNDEIYQQIQSIEDMDEYLENIEKKLFKEKQALFDELHQIESSQNDMQAVNLDDILFEKADDISEEEDDDFWTKEF